MEIKRNYFKELEAEISEPFTSILLGARQVGKSTLLAQLHRETNRRGIKSTFFNLELPSDLQKLSGSDAEVIDLLLHSGKVLFIDEFHYLKNATKIFKAIYDSKKGIKIFASGSSSIEIHRHLKESLAGRFRTTSIHPLSLEEYLTAPYTKPGEYFCYGGLPGLLHEQGETAKSRLLENILSTYLTKDIRSLIKEENVRAFNQLLYLIAQNQGSLSVVSSLARETGMTESTVSRHLDIMEHTYTSFALHSYSKNLANELKKSKKIYLFDLGIRNALLKDFSPLSGREDRGIINESFVFLHLKRQLRPNMEIRFWRTKKGEEVDFVVLKNRIPYPIEVKSNMQRPKIPKSLIRFLDAYPQSPMAFVFNENLEEEAVYKNKPVHFKKITTCGDLLLP